MDLVLSLLPPTHIVQIWIQLSPFYPLHTLYEYLSSSLPFTPTHIVQVIIQYSPIHPLNPLYKYGSSSLPFTHYTHCTNIYPVLSLLPLHTLNK